MHVVTSTRSADHSSGGPRDARDTAIPGVGEPGHGFGAILRRQSAPGRAEGGHGAVFELICFDCGDDLGLDYWEAPSRLQWLRGPRTMEAAWAAYARHVGLPADGQAWHKVPGRPS
jgi:hypothetical protein